MSAWVDRLDSTYAEGDALQLWLQSNENTYFTVVDVPAMGEAQVIFLNAHQPDSVIRASTALSCREVMAYSSCAWWSTKLPN